MTELEKLNRSVNRTLRELNDLAVKVASVSWPNRKRALDEVTQAVAHLDAMQRLIYADDPDLQYHYDANRPPTPAMAELAKLADEAEEQIRRGDVSSAKQTLQRALETEPPPLPYEAIEKRLRSLGE